VAQVHDLLVAEGGGASGRIVVDGGMTRSDLLLQIQSNLLNSNLNRVKQNEVTAFGCAYAAGRSMGFWEGKSVHEIIQNQEGYEIFEPDMSLDEREGVFTRWKDAVNRSFNLAKFSQKD
jgi:glycerol kinase